MQHIIVIGKYNSVLFVKRTIGNHRVESDLTIRDIFYMIAGVSGVLLYGYIMLLFISTHLNIVLSSTSNNIGGTYHHFGNDFYPLYMSPLYIKIINLQFLSLFLLLLKLLNRHNTTRPKNIFQSFYKIFKKNIFYLNRLNGTQFVCLLLILL